LLLTICIYFFSYCFHINNKGGLDGHWWRHWRRTQSSASTSVGDHLLLTAATAARLVIPQVKNLSKVTRCLTLFERSGVLRIDLFVWTLMWNITLDTWYEYTAYLMVKLLYHNAINMSFCFRVYFHQRAGHIGRETQHVAIGIYIDNVCVCGSLAAAPQCKHLVSLRKENLSLPKLLTLVTVKQKEHENYDLPLQHKKLSPESYI